MYSVRPSSSSLRCLSHSISSTSRGFTTTLEHKPDVSQQPSRYQRRQVRREQEQLERDQYDGPRPLYDPQKYMSSIPQPGFNPLPASTDPGFLAWISKQGNDGGARYQNPPPRGPNWMGGHVVSLFPFLAGYICLIYIVSRFLLILLSNPLHRYQMP
jgi:hypothetical protein